MNDLITSKDDYIYPTNNITIELDSMLTDENKQFIGTSRNYIYPRATKTKDGLFAIPIRYPGATRGCLLLDESMVIKNIRIYDDSDDIYIPSVRDCLSKYIGMKFVLKV